MSTQLEALGIGLIEGFDAAQLDPAPDVVVVGNVMTRGMPVIEALLESNIPYTSGDRKSTRLNSSHSQISYAVFCLKKKKTLITIGPLPFTKPELIHHTSYFSLLHTTSHKILQPPHQLSSPSFIIPTP